MSDHPEVEAEIVELLTVAQRHWNTVPMVVNDREARTHHIVSHVANASTAFLLKTLNETAPDVAAAALVGLKNMLADPGYTTEFIWEELGSRGLDPVAIEPFKAPAGA